MSNPGSGSHNINNRFGLMGGVTPQRPTLNIIGIGGHSVPCCPPRREVQNILKVNFMFYNYHR